MITRSTVDTDYAIVAYDGARLTNKWLLGVLNHNPLEIVGYRPDIKSRRSMDTQEIEAERLSANINAYKHAELIKIK